MLDSLRQRSATEPAERSPVSGERPDSRVISQMPFFRVGRLIYGGILAFMAVDGLLNTEERAQYAAAKDVPMPTVANIGSHALLLAGGIGVALWRVPRLSTSAVVTFFLGTTPMIHNFWSIDDPEQKQQQTIHFLKNAALLGTALMLLGIARREEK